MLRSSVTSPMRAHHTLRSSTRSSRERHHGDTHDVRKRHDSLDRSKLDASSRFFAAHTGNSARSVASRDSALFTEFVKTSQRSPHFPSICCILFFSTKFVQSVFWLLRFAGPKQEQEFESARSQGAVGRQRTATHDAGRETRRRQRHNPGKCMASVL